VPLTRCGHGPREPLRGRQRRGGLDPGRL
jgi:hypothetical protein